MKKRTWIFIAVLVGLLFLNIEAANAGLITRAKTFVMLQFYNPETMFFSIAVVLTGVLISILLMPVNIGTRRSVWLEEPRNTRKRRSYSGRKKSVNKILTLLKTKPLNLVE